MIDSTNILGLADIDDSAAEKLTGGVHSFRVIVNKNGKKRVFDSAAGKSSNVPPSVEIDNGISGSSVRVKNTGTIPTQISSNLFDENGIHVPDSIPRGYYLEPGESLKVLSPNEEASSIRVGFSFFLS